MIKGIIFDVDETLLNSMYIWSELGKRYFRNIMEQRAMKGF